LLCDEIGFADLLALAAPVAALVFSLHDMLLSLSRLAVGIRPVGGT
jgi:hypothetical protein